MRILLILGIIAAVSQSARAQAAQPNDQLRTESSSQSKSFPLDGDAFEAGNSGLFSRVDRVPFDRLRHWSIADSEHVQTHIRFRARCYEIAVEESVDYALAERQCWPGVYTGLLVRRGPTVAELPMYSTIGQYARESFDDLVCKGKARILLDERVSLIDGGRAVFSMRAELPSSRHRAGLSPKFPTWPWIAPGDEAEQSRGRTLKVSPTIALLGEIHLQCEYRMPIVAREKSEIERVNNIILGGPTKRLGYWVGGLSFGHAEEWTALSDTEAQITTSTVVLSPASENLLLVTEKPTADKSTHLIWLVTRELPHSPGVTDEALSLDSLPVPPLVMSEGSLRD